MISPTEAEAHRQERKEIQGRVWSTHKLMISHKITFVTFVGEQSWITGRGGSCVSMATLHFALATVSFP